MASLFQKLITKFIYAKLKLQACARIKIVELRVTIFNLRLDVTRRCRTIQRSIVIMTSWCFVQLNSVHAFFTTSRKSGSSQNGSRSARLLQRLRQKVSSGLSKLRGRWVDE